MGKKKVLILLLLLLGLATELITGTMGAADNSILQGAQEITDHAASSSSSSSSPSYASQQSPLPPSRMPPPDLESASLVASSPESDSLVCWSCSSSSHGNPCYSIDPNDPGSTASVEKRCSPEETFCSVVHIWYVVETGVGKENVNFSVNRTCSAECNPTCIVIGDRTKIHSCTSCCTESRCNTESSSSSRQTCSLSLLVSAFFVSLAPMLTISVMPTVTKPRRSPNKVTTDRSAASKVFLSSTRRFEGWRQLSKVVFDEHSSKIKGNLLLPLPVLLFFFFLSPVYLSWHLVSGYVPFKSFDNF